MQKSELTSVLDTGLDQNRISQAEYNHALHLYTLIYEENQFSECEDEHAALASLINKAANTDEEVLKARMKSECHWTRKARKPCPVENPVSRIV